MRVSTRACPLHASDNVVDAGMVLPRTLDRDQTSLFSRDFNQVTGQLDVSQLILDLEPSPVIDDGLALRRRHLVDPRVPVDRVVLVMRG